MQKAIIIRQNARFYKTSCYKWDKVFKNGPKNLWKTAFKKFAPPNLLKAVIHKFYMILQNAKSMDF